MITPLAYKPGSVGYRRPRIRTVIPLRAWSPTPSSSLPAACWSRWTASRCLFGLAPAGVCHAASVTRYAVSSYLTFSTLPDLTGEPCKPSAVRFLWHCPSREQLRAQALPGSLSMEPGLSSRRHRLFALTSLATVRPVVQLSKYSGSNLQHNP